jgi:uncharacterized protein (DUF305 family)
MKNKHFLLGGIIGLILGLMISPVLFRGSVYKCGPAKSGEMAQSIDRHFIEQMIPHHQGAITMAELALEKTKYPEIKSFAQGIIDAQQREITDMKKWYMEWFGSDVSAVQTHTMADHSIMENHMHMDSMSGDMAALSTAENFDLEFVRQMIPHHEMAVMMAQMLQASTNRQEMKTLADQIITSQSREIDMMRSWAKAWSAE